MNAICRAWLGRFFVGFIVTVAMLVVAGTSAASQTRAGALLGNFAVGPGGDAQYAIPIDVPPGILDVHPTLGLSYDSFTGNGKLGVGWSLTGLSAITRCKAVPYADHFWGSINYDKNDRYCLDAQRLINVTGSYGAASTVYRTELETWRLVQSSPALCGSGPCSFTVTSRGGVKWLYGTSADSRIAAANGVDVRVWALKQVVDLHGNTITVNYTGNPLNIDPPPADHDYYIQSIAYTSNGSFPANHSVTFAYQSRPDILTRFEGGTRIVTRALLAGITTNVQSTPVLTYGLTYETSAATRRSLVSRLQVCAGPPGSTNCLTPTVVHWQGAEQPAVGSIDLPSQLPGGFAQLLPADTNGDGRGDLVSTYTSSGLLHVDVHRSTGSDLVPCGSSLQTSDAGTPLQLMDMNGDGRADLLQVASNQGTQSFYWYLAQSDGCSFSSAGSMNTSFPSNPNVVWPMDVNGDGRGDLVEGWISGSTITLSSLISNGHGFDTGTTQKLTLGPSPQLFPADVNGDGLVDLVQSWTNGSGLLTFTAYRSNGMQFDDGTDSSLDADNRGVYLQVDVNDDGLSDVVQAWSDHQNLLHLTTWIADGVGRFTSGGDVNTQRGTGNTIAIWPLDLTGDFGTDLVQIWDNQGQLNLVTYRRSGTNGTSYDQGVASATPLASANIHQTWPMDIDGDSRMELTQAWPPGGRNALMVTRNTVTGPAADLVDTITDGLQGQIVIAYRSMADPAIYTAAAQTYPQTPGMAYEYRDAPSQAPFHVVSGGKAQLVSGYTFQSPSSVVSGAYGYTHAMHYEGAAIDMTGHGWLGFASVSDTNTTTGRVISTTYNQAFPLTGTVAAVASQCVAIAGSPGDPQCTSNTPTTLDVKTTTYHSAQLAPSFTGLGAVWTSQPSALRFDTYSYGTYNFSIGIAFQYDAYSNVTLESYLGYVHSDGSDISPDENVYTCTAYSNTVTADGWILGYPTAIKRSSSGTCGDYSAFHSADSSLALMAYTRAMQIDTLKSWDSSNGVYLIDRHTYDSFGNTLTTSEPGNRVTTYTYEGAYHTYQQTQTTPPNENGVSLTSTYGFDPRFGNLVALTDQNGLTTLNCVDPFGGLAASQSPIPSFAATTPDVNCVSPLVTGPAASFQAAKVVTTESQSIGNDPSGNVFMEVSQLQSWGSGTTRELLWRRTYYDGLGRGYQEVDQGSPSSANTVVCRTYDPQDMVLTESLPYFLAGNEDNCAPKENDPRQWVRNTYDAYVRMKRSVRPAGPTGGETSITTATYSGGDTATFTYAAGDHYALTKTQKYRYYDSDRKLSQLIFVSDGNAVSNFGYDRFGRLTSAVDPPTKSNPAGVSNTIVYDSLDRRTSVANPDQNTSGGTATSWTYDPATGFAIASTDARGQTTRFAYDAMARQTRIVEADGKLTKFSYDDPHVANGKGRLCHVTATTPNDAVTPLYTYDFTYEADDQPASRAVTLGAGYGPYVTKTHYDPLERLWQLTYPDHSVLTNTYSGGNLVRSAIGSTVYATYSNFTPEGRPQNIAYGNGTAATFSYAPSGEPISQTVRDSSAASLLDRTLTWNHLGHVTANTDNLKKGVDYSQSYTYTSGRLTGAQAPALYPAQTWTYDASGNVTAAGDIEYAYHAHRIAAGTQNGSAIFSAGYDANGNMSSRTTGQNQWSYTYDTLNRLTRVTRDGATVLSVPLYDHLGVRLLRTDAEQTNTIYVDSTYVVIELPGHYVTATKYVVDGDGTVAAITTLTSGAPPPGEHGYPDPGTLYFHTDYLDSTSITTTGDGKLSSIFAYAPYGAIAEGTSGPDNVRQKYSGKELDEDSSLYYYGARYYDPTTGRFLTPDTVLSAQLDAIDALNRFAFALNNPASFVDPTGHSVASFFGALLGLTEIMAGIAVDVLSAGALEPLGGALIGAGTSGLDYSLTHTNDFSWSQYGTQTGIGAAMGLFTGGFGGEAAGLSRGGARIAEREMATLAGVEEREAMQAVEGAELRTSGRTAAQGELDAEASFLEAGEDVAPCICSAASFVGGTIVATDEGPKPVEEIAIGDSVFGFDPETREAGTYRVTDTARRESSIFRISAAGLEIEAAPAELFWIAGRGWTEARQLQAGDSVVDVHGQSHAIDCVTPVEVPQAVFEFEVASAHTFYASDAALLVHNPKKPKCREAALGRTPSKTSAPGRKVWDSFKAQGRAKTESGVQMVEVDIDIYGTRKWKRLGSRKVHMGHIKDAVHEWNTNLWQHGAKSKQARKFMMDHTNYRFEYGPLNSGNGAKLKMKYRQPAGWTKPWPPQ